MIPLLLLLAAIIIASLSIYAYRLTSQVKEQEAQREKASEAALEKQRKQTLYIEESLQVISANVLDENLNLSEATIRCKMLLDALLLGPELRQPYQILDVVFEQVKDFDTHQARKQLTSKQRQAQDAQREAIENEHREALMACFTELRQFKAPQD